MSVHLIDAAERVYQLCVQMSQQTAGTGDNPAHWHPGWDQAVSDLGLAIGIWRGGADIADVLAAALAEEAQP